MKFLKNEKPFECAYCSNFFVSSHYFILTLRTGEQFGICERCKYDVVCERCGKRLKRSELYIEECSICDKIYLTCSKCRTKKEGILKEFLNKIRRILFTYLPFGIMLKSTVIKCCIKDQKDKVIHTSIIYLKKLDNKKKKDNNREK